MPNRILRDWTDSERINTLDASTERFFTRLIMRVDDYGRFYANPKLLKPGLFPFLLDQISEADIETWLCNLCNAGVITLYETGGKKYLQIERFKQHLRQKREKYPAPQKCTTDEVQEHSTQHTSAYPDRNEAETEVEEKGNKAQQAALNPTLGGGQGGAAAKTIDEKIQLLAARALKFKEALRAFTTEYPAQMLEDFFQYWTEANPGYTKLRFEMEKTWEVQKRLANWAKRDKNFNKKPNHGQNSGVRKGQPDTGAIRAVARKILESAGGGTDNG